MMICEWWLQKSPEKSKSYMAMPNAPPYRTEGLAHKKIRNARNVKDKISKVYKLFQVCS